MTQYHLKLREGDVAPYVLLPGDPGRVPVIAATWDTAERMAGNREYVTYTGTYKGAPISCTSTGIGAPSTSIAMEELARCGARTFLRVGTCGTFQDDVANGDMAIFDAAMRLDGASRAYAPVEYPAVAHHEVVQAAITAAQRLGLPHHVGITRSADTFYASHPRPGSSFNDFHQSWWAGQFDDLRQLNVLAGEMEASIVLVLARAWRLRAGGLAVVMDNIRNVPGESAVFDPQTQLDHGQDHIERLARLANETVFALFEHDARTRPAG
ncbi:nucleoside phosphorylase [Jiangella endophytica]|uniref:nucleoside phosphorylase n=1 Tax=Jiangella endophytica TaxID=1623398 RepID=UPI0018E5041B|nr:nucleoside phosphorylase [Jiangella endophytica]